MSTNSRPPIVHIDEDKTELDLEQHGSPELYAVLEEFGRMMLASAQAHTAAIEAKALGVLGWTAALVALAASRDLVSSVRSSRALIGLVVVGALAAVGALISSALSLRMRTWHAPSQTDWMRADLFAQPLKLRRYQLLSLLESYSAHCRNMNEQAWQLNVAQWALVAAALMLGLVLIVSALVTPDAVGVSGGSQSAAFLLG